MKKMRLFSLILGVMFASVAALQGQVLLNEQFDYPIGDSLSAHGWSAHSGAGPISVISGSLTYPSYFASAGGSALLSSSAAQDMNRSFTVQTSGSVYAAILFNVTSASATGDYFFHFFTPPTSYPARVYIKKDATDATKFTVGILKGSSATSVVYSPTLLSTNTTHLIVLKYTILPGATNDIVSLFVNPSLSAEGTPTIIATDVTSADASPVSAIALRQGSPSSASTLTVDELRVATTWTDAVGTGGGIDLTPPTVSAANALNATSVRVTFSEPVSAATAENLGNYTIVGNTITSAILSGGNTVTLVLGTSLTPNTNYTLTINNISDVASTPNTMTVAQDLTINFIVNNVANIAELKTKAADNITVYTLTGEAVMTFKQSNRNQKFVQDASGAILIDDQAGALTTVYNIGDGITGIVGKLTTYYGQYQFIPTQDAGVATTSANVITPLEVTIAQMQDTATFKQHQSKLIRIVGVKFTDANGTLAFNTNKNYRLTVGTTTDSTFKTSFYSTNYITTPATVLPQGSGSITGITQLLYGQYKITARDLADINLIVGVNETANESINIYPNPAKNFVNVNLDGTYDIKVLSLLGQHVYSQANASGLVRIDCAQLGKGVFFIQARNAKNETITKRVVVE